MNIESNIWVSPLARIRAEMLYIDLHVSPGRGLAPFLGIDAFYSNYDAICLWVEEKLATDYSTFSDYNILKCSLIGEVPDYIQGQAW